MQKLHSSSFVKTVVIAVLVVVLAVPLVLTRGVVEERRSRRDAVGEEVAAAWGGPQEVAGPVLAVPSHGIVESDGVLLQTSTTYYFLPAELELAGELVPEVRQRGIFEWVVYRADLRLTGRFAPLDLAGWRVEPADLDWAGARLQLGFADVHGLRRAELSWDGREVPLSPGGRVESLWTDGVQALVGSGAAGAAGPAAEHRFEATLSLLGSESLEVLPVGGSTRVQLASSWPDPSFVGGFLPEERRVGEDGFRATWSVSDLAQGRPRRWRAGELGDGWAVHARRPGVREELEAPAWRQGFASLGVALYRPVDHYQRTERSLKYALLFVLLTFVTLFLHEVAGPVALHPMHYLLVGAALVLFYLLLLSLSEHVGFTLAYLVAAGVVVVQVTGYAAAVLRQRRRALTLGAVTAALYGYFWVLLDAEDYALLIGSVGLFAVLGLVMYLTRRLDWSAPAASRGPG